MRVPPLKLWRVRQSDKREKLHHRIAAVQARFAAMRREHLRDLAPDANTGIERGGWILRNIADAPAPQPVQLSSLQRNEIAIPEPHLSRLNPHDGVAKTKELQGHGRLAASGLAHKAKHFSPADGEAHIIHHSQPASTLPIGYGEIGDRKQLACHWVPSRTVRPRIRASPSVNRLSPTTREASASPGPSTVIGETISSALFSLIIRPHSGVGGRRPNPRNPSDPMRTGA